MSTFADAEVIEMCKTDFVPVCTDDWYTRRRKDDEGTFFMKVSDQTVRKGTDGTRQGMYLFTADGELLRYANSGQDAAFSKKLFREAKREFDKLPLARTKPEALTIPPLGKPDPQYARALPEGGLALRVNARILENKGADWLKGTCKFTGGDKSSRDFLWLLPAEVKSLAPAKTDVGHIYEVPFVVARRIARFHLVDNTRGEPSFWHLAQVRTSRHTLTVVKSTPEEIELRWDGEALMSTKPEAEKSEYGYDVKLRGTLKYNPAKGTFTSWEMVALGDHWGEAGFTRDGGARPGRTPLGIAFGLADPTKPGERIAPEGARDWGNYTGKE